MPHADAAAADHGKACRQLPAVGGEQGLERGGSLGDRGAEVPEQDDAGRRLPGPERQLAEVLVLGEQHPPFLPCNGEHFMVGGTAAPVTGGRHVEALPKHPSHEPTVQAFVGEEPQAAAGAGPNSMSSRRSQSAAKRRAASTSSRLRCG